MVVASICLENHGVALCLRACFSRFVCVLVASRCERCEPNVAPDGVGTELPMHTAWRITCGKTRGYKSAGSEVTKCDVTRPTRMVCFSFRRDRRRTRRGPTAMAIYIGSKANLL